MGNYRELRKISADDKMKKYFLHYYDIANIKRQAIKRADKQYKYLNK
jgi:hypothetical protein